MGPLAVFELDSVQGSYLDQLTETGELPVIASLRARAARLPLVSTSTYCAEYPPTEFLTGRTPDENRYWSTVVFDPKTYRCRRVGSAEIDPFYALGDRATVVSFDVPHAILSSKVTGTQVVGWGGHDARFQYPRVSAPTGVMDEIDRRFGTDPVRPIEYSGFWWQTDYLEQLVDASIAGLQRRARIASWLIEGTRGADVFLMGVPEAHGAGHVMAHGLDAAHLLATHPSASIARESFLRLLRAVDEAVGEVLSTLPSDTTACVCSPKGMEPTVGDLAGGVLLPELLLRTGTGRTLLHEPAHDRWRADGCPLVIPEGSLGSWMRARRRESSARRVRRRLGRYTPSVLKRVAHRARATTESGGAIEDESLEGMTPSWYRPYWARQRAFALPSFSDGHIRLNVIGRERDGLVAPLDYDRTCDEIDAELRTAVDVRTGRPAVSEVVRMRADDPMADDGPGADLVVRFAVTSDAIEHPRAGTIGPFPFPRSGSHTADGFAYVAGPGVAPGGRVPALVTELPATLLQLTAP